MVQLAGAFVDECSSITRKALMEAHLLDFASSEWNREDGKKLCWRSPNCQFVSSAAWFSPVCQSAPNQSVSSLPHSVKSSSLARFASSSSWMYRLLESRYKPASICRFSHRPVTSIFCSRVKKTTPAFNGAEAGGALLEIPTTVYSPLRRKEEKVREAGPCAVKRLPGQS